MWSNPATGTKVFTRMMLPFGVNLLDLKPRLEVPLNRLLDSLTMTGLSMIVYTLIEIDVPPQLSGMMYLVVDTEYEMSRSMIE
jgi:hypothetical protein